MTQFVEITAPQRSPEWHVARAGRLTGSRAKDILKAGKSGATESVARRDYRLQLVAERIAGTAQEQIFVSQEMQRGIDLEPAAFAAYEADTGTMVMKSGFLQHTEHMAGCSLDGHIGAYSGILEIKCPKMATHLTYINSPELLSTEYRAQVQHNLWITGAAFCDLISFDDRLPKKLQLFRVRLERYNMDIEVYQVQALKFLSEVQTQYDTIMEAAS